MKTEEGRFGEALISGSFKRPIARLIFAGLYQYFVAAWLPLGVLPHGAMAIDPTPPGPPKNLTLTAKTETTVTLQWNAPGTGDVQSYEVLRDGKEMAVTSETSYVCSGLNPNVPGTFRVRARDRSGIRSAPSNAVVATPQAGAGELHPKVVRTQFRALVLVYDPVVDFDGVNQRLGQHVNARDVGTLTSQYIELLRKASGGQVNWSVAYRFDLDEFPLPANQNQPAFTPANYVQLRAQGYDYWNVGGPDYRGILADPRFGLVEKINSEDVDAVWVFAPDGSGFWETAMAGPSAYWVNGSPIIENSLTRKVVIYAFGRASHQGVGFMCENTCHMAENIMKRISSSWPRTTRVRTWNTLNLSNPSRDLNLNLVNDWTHFTQSDAASWDPILVAPGSAQAGLSHYPPTAGRNYGWGTLPFNLANISDFRSIDGDWTTEGTGCTVTAGPFARLLPFDGTTMTDACGSYHPPIAFTDADVELSVRIESNDPAAHAGLIFRVSRCLEGGILCTGYYLGLQPNPGRIFLWRYDSTPTLVGDQSCALAPNQTYRVRLEARGCSFKVFLDGACTPVLSLEDNVWLSGGFGLAASSGKAVFGGLTVVPHSANHADDWYGYPDEGEVPRDLSALDWKGDTWDAMDQWYAWWWEHLPKNGGGHYAQDLVIGWTEFILNTWWPYIFDINNFTSSWPCADIVFAPEDFTPPQAPPGLQAVPLSSSQVALAWDPAADNVGVTRYAVYRDGALVRTTPDPCFTDTGLAPRTPYRYAVKAWDGSGQLSEPSAAILVRTFASDALGVVIDGAFEVAPQPAGWISEAFIRGTAQFQWEPAGTGRNGTRCASINASSGNDARWMQTVTGLTPGGLYWLSGSIKGENIVRDAGAAVGANLCLMDNWSHTGPALDGTFDWQRVSLPFNAPASGSVVVGCRLGFWGSLASGKAWFDDIQISTNDPALNRPPTAVNDVLHRFPNQGVKVHEAVLLANDTDPDGDFLGLTWVGSPTVHQGTVLVNDGWLSYLPASGWTGSDTFSYVISDGHGGTDLGQVLVSLVDDAAESHNKLSIESRPGGGFRITFNGIPNRTYSIQQATTLGDWKTLGTATADALGIYLFEDVAGAAVCFYRSVFP